MTPRSRRHQSHEKGGADDAGGVAAGDVWEQVVAAAAGAGAAVHDGYGAAGAAASQSQPIAS